MIVIYVYKKNLYIWDLQQIFICVINNKICVFIETITDTDTET